MKRNVTHLLLLILIPFLFFACDRNRIFEAYEKLPETGWHKDSLLTFPVPIDNTVQPNNLYINVRNDIKYKYSNLWLFIKIEEPGETAVADTFEVVLANPAGKWLGDGFGGIKTTQVLYKRNVYFTKTGKYKVTIQHGMRDYVLKGITDIGFRVEKSGEK